MRLRARIPPWEQESPPPQNINIHTHTPWEQTHTPGNRSADPEAQYERNSIRNALASQTKRCGHPRIQDEMRAALYKMKRCGHLRIYMDAGIPVSKNPRWRGAGIAVCRGGRGGAEGRVPGIAGRAVGYRRSGGPDWLRTGYFYD